MKVPARPAMLDEIGSKIGRAVVSEVVRPVCCFKSCKKRADFFIVLRYADRRTDMFGVCAADKRKLAERHATALSEEKDQPFFVY